MWHTARRGIYHGLYPLYLLCGVRCRRLFLEYSLGGSLDITLYRQQQYHVLLIQQQTDCCIYLAYYYATLTIIVK